MGFWYTDAQDHTGAWYWIGLAINLCQSLGLHRSPQSTQRGPRLSEAKQSLHRRIWWSCLVRDRWISLAKGRPMRIHDEDCDTPVPSIEDILNELKTLSTQARDRFIPSDTERLAKMWVRLVNLSAILGKILRVHYRVDGPKPSTADIDKYSEELRNCTEEPDYWSNTVEHITLIHAYHIELFYQCV
jgi:hypothetical protein